MNTNNLEEHIFDRLDAVGDKISDLSQMFFRQGKYKPPEDIKTEEMYFDAEKLYRLEIFLPNNIPDDAEVMWNKLTNDGNMAVKFKKKINDSPKLMFKRMLSKKNDEYQKLKKEFQKKYGFDYKDIDIQHSSTTKIVKKQGAS
jgi:hypothetical protein